MSRLLVTNATGLVAPSESAKNLWGGVRPATLPSMSQIGDSPTQRVVGVTLTPLRNRVSNTILGPRTSVGVFDVWKAGSTSF